MMTNNILLKLWKGRYTQVRKYLNFALISIQKYFMKFEQMKFGLYNNLKT